ncbi:unnamed protein product [Lactuca saligna]|uniref:Uncharacterized protein n=1 Tax=Lactuca saligna TaxID=75948 RepID=A0AA36DY02_LACSI|nr:unnamed protein product [Lactuca saligna]
MLRKSANPPLGGDDEGSGGDRKVRNTSGVENVIEAASLLKISPTISYDSNVPDLRPRAATTKDGFRFPDLQMMVEGSSIRGFQKQMCVSNDGNKEMKVVSGGGVASRVFTDLSLATVRPGFFLILPLPASIECFLSELLQNRSQHSLNLWMTNSIWIFVDLRLFDVDLVCISIWHKFEVLLTETHLAIVMEYAAGGEFDKITNVGRFSEDEGNCQSSLVIWWFLVRKIQKKATGTSRDRGKSKA